MLVQIIHPYADTIAFLLILISVMLVSLRIKNEADFLSSSVTQELKGLAILGVIFCHVGYFLATDSRFLFPLSIAAGVSVNIFLFLSGYGLTMSQLARHLSPIAFYKKRLVKLYIPFWISLAIFFLASFFIGHISYSPAYMMKSFAGFFPSANLYTDIDSPLWYFSFIIFFYLLFPLFFSRKWPWLSAIGIFSVSYAIVVWNPSSLGGVMSLYADHIAAFPLGMIAANLVSQKSVSSQLEKMFMWPNYVRRFVLFLLVLFIAYFSYHSFVGTTICKEQAISMCVVLALLFLFILSKLRFEALTLLGLYSYEIYLIHWPIMYHYDFFFVYFAPWLAMTLYLVLFIFLGFLLKKVSDRIINVW